MTKKRDAAPGLRLQRYLTAKVLAIVLTIGYVVSLIPLLAISFYNYPGADDFTNASACHQVWEKTGSVFAVLSEAFGRMCNEWQTWRGSFLASFLSALSPNLWSEKAYFITPWLVLFMLSFGTIYLLRMILVKGFGADKYVSHCVSMAVLIVTVQCMVGPVEAFYWYSGAINYTFTHGLCLLFYGLLLSAALDNGKKKICSLWLSSLLGFLIGGGNQMTMLNAAIVLVSAIVLLTILKKWSSHKLLIIPMTFFFAGFVLNVAAPGNWVRAGSTGGMNPVKAIFVSFYYCLEYCLGEWSGWPVILLVILLVPLFLPIARRTRFAFPYPLVVVLFGYCVVSAMMTPALFATGNLEAGRLQGLTFTMYILVLSLCVGYVTGWVSKRITYAAAEAEGNGRFTVNECWCILGCLLFIGIAVGITVIPDAHYFAFSSAVTDLSDGSAQAYKKETEARTALYHSGAKQIIVSPFKEQPKLLYFSDVKSSSDEWENRGVCRFYGLDSVQLIEITGE